MVVIVNKNDVCNLLAYYYAQGESLCMVHCSYHELTCLIFSVPMRESYSNYSFCFRMEQSSEKCTWHIKITQLGGDGARI